MEHRIQHTLEKFENPALAHDIWQILANQHFHGFFSAEKIDNLCEKYAISPETLALMLLPVASCYANPAISQFSVGAIVKGERGHFYFGANQEFNDHAIAHTIHAEQSAISHAWIQGERGITDIFINYSPCGHCRQFMNELNTAQHLKIHLPNQPVQSLAYYLPHAFGPSDLNIQHLLLDEVQHKLTYASQSPLIQEALDATNQSHAPYSHAYCGVALALENGQIIKGRYAENAAFNPSLPALQVALNLVIMQGFHLKQIRQAVMIEHSAGLSYRHSAENLFHTLGIPFQYIAVGNSANLT